MTVKFTKLSVLLPIAIGIVFGAMLFVVGYTQDGPGACVVGIALTFGLTLLGISNAGVIKKGYLAPILLLCYGAGITFLSVLLFFDGEFEGFQHMFFVGLALGIILLVVGAILFCKHKK